MRSVLFNSASQNLAQGLVDDRFMFSTNVGDSSQQDFLWLYTATHCPECPLWGEGAVIGMNSKEPALLLRFTASSNYIEN